MKEQMVTIFLPRGRKNEENFVIVSVNGRSWKIMKGVQVQVPDYVAEVLENSRMMAETARLTAGRMLGRVDALLPNQYSREEKMRWLAEAEGFVLREVRQLAGALPEVTEDYVLTAEAPYDQMYRYYVEAQIHYANGETVRYNNAAAQWNNAFLTYKDYCCRTAAPRRTTAALHLF